MEKLKTILLSKRFKSFYWGTLAMIVAYACTFLTSQLTDLQIQFNIPEFVVVEVGLVLAQITKYLNNKYGLQK